MIYKGKLFIEKILKYTRSSERKFKEGNYKAAIEERRKVRSLFKSELYDEQVLKKFKQELSYLYISKFDLINDHKLRIDELKINNIVMLLEKKSDEKYHKGDFKGAIRALRRSEKYLVNKTNSV